MKMQRWYEICLDYHEKNTHSKKSDENQIGFRRFFLESTYTGVDNTGTWAYNFLVGIAQKLSFSLAP